MKRLKRGGGGGKGRKRSVAHELSHLNLKSILSTIGVIAFGAIYHLSCLAALVNCARQHNNGKVIITNQKVTPFYITITVLISHK